MVYALTLAFAVAVYSMVDQILEEFVRHHD